MDFGRGDAGASTVLNALICHHVVVLDARRRADFEKEHLVGSVNVDALSVYSVLISLHGLAWSSMPLILLASDAARDANVIAAIHAADPRASVAFFAGGISSVLAEYSFLSSTGAMSAPLSQCPCEIIDGFLFLGGLGSRAWASILQITHVLNFCGEGQPLGESCSELVCSVEDESDVQIKNYFSQSYDYIEAAREKGGRVLMHCGAGISRSPTVAAAYLMKRFGMDYREAMSAIQKRRPSTNPNPGFQRQLYLYWQSLHIRKKSV